MLEQHSCALAGPSRCVPDPRSSPPQALCEPGWVGSCLSLPSDRNCSSTGTKGLVGGVREASGEQQPLMCCCGVCRRGAAPGLGRRPSPRSAGLGTVGFGTRGQWPGLPCATPVTSSCSLRSQTLFPCSAAERGQARVPAQKLPSCVCHGFLLRVCGNSSAHSPVIGL